MRIGYKPLFQANEYAYKLNETDLKGLIVQVTGLEKDNRVAQLTQQTWKRLAAHASFDSSAAPVAESKVKKEDHRPEEELPRMRKDSPLRLSYTINLNLPATTNPEVFAAIFKSLREHLLDG